MKVIFQHPTGNANVRAALEGLNKANGLFSFYTTIACFPESMLSRLGNIKSLSEIQRRSFNNDLKQLTKTYPYLEIGRLLALKTGFGIFSEHETGILSIDAVYQNLDNKVAAAIVQKRKEVTAIYAYEDGAALSFREAKKHGLQCLYDLPIGYWRTARRLLENERENWPEWVPTLTGFKDSEIKLARKDEELRLADKIFVASSFTANTLKEFPGKLAPVKVIPYGFPPPKSRRDYPLIRKGRPLKLLFVGGLTQRKGIAHLFAAIKAFGTHVELSVVGRKTGGDCPTLDAALAKHRWIPSLPHAGILQLMQEHDVLVFPSLFEGFGLVITEAMSQGTPVITTERTAGPDLIESGNNGWLIEAGSTEALKSAIENLLIRPQQISEAGKAAMETARLRPWEVYGRELAESIIQK